MKKWQQRIHFDTQRENSVAEKKITIEERKKSSHFVNEDNQLGEFVIHWSPSSMHSMETKHPE